jgi:DNA-binding LacI/PurR family transcriptional regulator
MTDEIKQLVYAIKNDGVLNGHDTPNNEWERQIQELIATARIDGLIMARYGVDDDSKEERFIDNLIRQEEAELKDK